MPVIKHNNTNGSGPVNTMDQLCALLENCTPENELTEIYFADTLEVIFSENFDKKTFIAESSRIFSGRLVNNNSLLRRVGSNN